MKKIGLDKFAHFGIGGTLFASFVGAFSLSLPYGEIVELSFRHVLLVPLSGYIILAMAEVVKEVFIDSKGDWWDVLATMLGGIFVHACAIIGYSFHFLNGKDLITSACGWTVFGVVMVALAVLWIIWAIRSARKKAD